MTRISDIGLQQILLNGFQRAQGSAQERQIQLATGKVSTAYGGIGARTLELLSAEGVLARAGAYDGAAKTALARLQMQETGMTSVADAVSLMRERMVQALATGSAELLLPEIETAAQRVIMGLNTQIGGVYVFGGTDGAAPPLEASGLADFGAAANTDDLFLQAERSRLPVEEGVSVDGGATALEVGGALAAELKELANAEAALGPFSGELTAAQRDFLIDKIARLDEIAADLYQELGLNGVAQGQAEDARTRNIQRRDLAEIVASDIEDADIAEVVARLNQDRLAVEASARALAQATELSLLNYI
ncbi:MAG: flagellin [Parvularculaceae bacterium]